MTEEHKEKLKLGRLQAKEKRLKTKDNTLLEVFTKEHSSISTKNKSCKTCWFWRPMYNNRCMLEGVNGKKGTDTCQSWMSDI